MNGKIYRLVGLALVPLAALLVIIGGAGAAPRGGVKVELKVAQGEFRSSQDVLVTVTFSNPSKQPARILRWFTPADGVDESLFTVTRDGQPVAYTGAYVKRPAATDADYLALAPGASISSVADLGDSYDLTGTGRYEISYDVASYDLFGKGAGAKSRDALASDKISLKVAGRAAKGKPNPPPPPPPPSSNTLFNACSSSQQSALLSAREQAKLYAADASAYLVAGNQAARYTTWFGVVGTTGRYPTVKSHFSAISGAIQTATITFDCSSRRKVYAYVYPGEPYKIYLGSVYWSAPASGTDSKAGTLIHEMSHFTVVAGTNDVVYGQAGAKALAISDPDSAITNADSHEYFAENTPSLP